MKTSINKEYIINVINKEYIPKPAHKNSTWCI